MYSPELFPHLPKIPTGFRYGNLLVEPLSIAHALIDFEAVSVSKEYLHKKYQSKTQWPLYITLHDNIVDLGWHEKEFRDKSSFAYTIANSLRTKCFGCIYIYPRDGQATMSFWLRNDGTAPITEEKLRELLTKWFAKEWLGVNIQII